ncbi:hypothetical protein ACVRXQ_11940 [Streptococcus panodentis]|uniref:Phage protein n=1 Tax=Streptococcus panodentis TaxID=1581472 RepID=A0ABS5AX60_9STRE|nr:hypothetical protein [Streptococcus panodentis]MBP2621157.1 hypothetical protein [Streptococcus panodentis]
MDFEKLKGFAKTAVDKTAEGIGAANKKRKKAAAETKITLPASNQFASSTTVRKTVDGQYYIGFYTEDPVLYEFVGFEFAGSTIKERTKTTGKTKQQGRSGSVVGGAAIGTVLAPGVGTIIGGMAGGARKKKGTINSTSVTTQEEKPGTAKVMLRNAVTGELKTIKTKLTNAEAGNIDRFFR